MRRLALFTFLLFLAFSGCKQKEKRIIFNNDISAIESSKGKIKINLKDDDCLKDIVDLSVFHNMYPVYSGNEAEKIWGESDNTILDYARHIREDEWWFNDSMVVMKNQEDAGGNVKRTLCAVPYPSTENEIIKCLDTLVAIHEAPPNPVVLIHGKDGNLLMYCKIKGARVESLVWMRPSEP